MLLCKVHLMEVISPDNGGHRGAVFGVNLRFERISGVMVNVVHLVGVWSEEKRRGRTRREKEKSTSTRRKRKTRTQIYLFSLLSSLPNYHLLKVAKARPKRLSSFRG